MSYDTIADAVLTLVRAYDNGATYTKANSSIENWKVLDARGIALSAIVAQFGDSQEGPSLDGHAQQGYWQEHHEIGIIVAYKVKTEDDARSIDALHAAVQALKVYIRSYPRLGAVSGVKHAYVVRTTRRRPIAPQQAPQRATHWCQTIVLNILEQYALAWTEAPQ
jgi:hypothetical protein